MRPPSLWSFDVMALCGEYLYTVHTIDRTIFRCSTNDLIQSLTCEKISNESLWNEHCNNEILDGSAYVAIQDRLISVGGGTDDKGDPTKEVRMYSLETEKWKVIGKIETPRRECFAAILPDNTVIVMGGLTTSQNNSATDSSEIATWCFNS